MTEYFASIAARGARWRAGVIVCVGGFVPRIAVARTILARPFRLTATFGRSFRTNASTATGRMPSARGRPAARHARRAAGARASCRASRTRASSCARIISDDADDADAAARFAPVALRRRRRSCCGAGSPKGAEYTEHWAFRPLPDERRRSGGARRSVAAADARSLRAGAAGSGEADAVAAGRAAATVAAADARSHRPAADGRGDAASSNRRRPKIFDAALAAGGRSPAGQPGVRRAHGRGLARRGPLRRLVRLPIGPAQHAVAVPRLGRAGAQRQPAVRPVPHVAARRRPAAESRRATRFSPRRSTACIA